ncbi:MAG: response regulator [Deltaproteobacteria bacterium]|nr:response regulator [Deltaproteobacteria bacterium]MCL5277633.1 response regulator [Deltaproteobacteria bacterium]
MTRVMIVDDEVNFAQNTARLLHENDGDMEVFPVFSAEEALERLEASPVDIIVTDIRLPLMNGITFMEIVKNRWPRTALIVMTAFGAKEVIVESLSLGSLFYIEKPFRIEKLENVIKMTRMKK